MVSASFQQTSFLGGEWSEDAQGRITDPNYKRALSASLNGMPTETGAWTRRPGFRFLGITRHGAAAKLFEFDFSTVQPYQIVLTDGFMRMFAGLAPVIADDANGYLLLNVSTATPAVVLTRSIPNTWADGDTVVFDLKSDPCNGPALCGREFTIKSVNTTTGTFALYDPITDAAIDGSTIAYAANGTYVDVVKKIFELATPYVSGQWKDVRVVNNGTQVTIFHPLYKPKSLAIGVTEPFALTDQDFSDGPYLDLNETTTTLTPSGTTGSITMTASSTTGINGGAGFKTTDVGRHLRFQSAPPAWSNGPNYAKAAQVTGSDGNVYQAVASSAGIDPTTDTGTHWIIAATSATWVWMKITAWTSTTVVTCLVQGVTDLSQESPTLLGNTLSSVSPQRVWMLGSFSDTTGWPSLGCYHSGRLWLANTSEANRYDAGVDGDFFNFCPTALDGSISDANGFSDVIQTEEVDAVFWMLSTGDGLVIGTQGSEHRIRASVLDDPLSFVNQQERRVSKFGSKNAEAILPWGRPVFLQRQGRRMLSLRPVTDARYDGDHLTQFAAQIATRGFEEIRWQQEPSLILWARLSDGGLAGAVFRDGEYRFGYEMADMNYKAFFPVTHAYSRSFDSISTGPNFDGTSDTLYAITNQTDNTKPDYNVHHVEYMMPVFNAAMKDWGAFFVDGGSSPCCGRKFLVSNGDSFSGVRLYGLTYLNGLTTSVVIGGLDIGDFAVANGHIDIPFGSPVQFTEAFFNALNNGTDYGAFEADASFVQPLTNTPPVAANSLMGLVGAATPVGYNNFGGTVFVDHGNDKLYFRETGTATGTAGIKKIDGAVPGDELLQATETNIFGAGPAHTLPNQSGCFHPMGKIFLPVDTISNSQAIAKIDATTLVVDEVVGTTGSSTLASTCDASTGVLTRLLGSFQMIPLQAGTTDYLVSRATASFKEVAVLNVTATGSMLLLYAVNIVEAAAGLCAGHSSSLPTASFYALGRKFTYGLGDSTPSALYEYLVFGSTIAPANVYASNEAVSRRTVRASIAPPDIDVTWTNFTAVSNPGYDTADGNIVAFFSTLDTVTQKDYLVKFNAISGAVMWATGVSNGVTTSVDLPQCDLRGTLEVFDYSQHAVVRINLATGAISSTTAWSHGLVLSGAQVFEAVTGSITLNCAYSGSLAPVPAYIGDYLPANADAIPSGRWGRIYSGVTYGSNTVTQFAIPSSIGLAYTSNGQLLPPDAGADAGARNGPAFGKKRRVHWYAAHVVRTRGLKFGSDLAGKMRPMTLASGGGTIVAPPSLISDVVTTTIDNDYSFKGQIAWSIDRPYPVTITTIGGYIESMDK